MKTIAAFSKAEEAHLLRARLEGSGMPAVVRDDVDWLYSESAGGVKVAVADDDYPAALALLADEELAAARAAAPSAPPPPAVG